MSPSFLFSQFMGGLTAAMFLFLIASGLSLVFGVMRVLNFAHGSFYMIGAYIAWQVVQWLQPTPERFWPAVLAAAVGVALLHRDVRARFRAGRHRRRARRASHGPAPRRAPCGPGWCASASATPQNSLRRTRRADAPSGIDETGRAADQRSTGLLL